MDDGRNELILNGLVVSGTKALGDGIYGWHDMLQDIRLPELATKILLN